MKSQGKTQHSTDQQRFTQRGPVVQAKRLQLSRVSRLALFVAGGLVAAATGCLDRPVAKLSPETTSLIVAKISQDRVDKIDLLFMIDNSASMADKQVILQAAVPDLVGRLVNPVCVDGMGVQHPESTPDSPELDCPDGMGREFEPIIDINIAVITSSLGGFGATSNACKNGYMGQTEKEDMGRLLGSLPRGVEALAGATHVDPAGLGFLQWRGDNRPGLETSFSSLVTVTGEQGCGFEASLESWYRFLVDPEPFLSLAAVDCTAGSGKADCRSPSGIDEVILAQRAAFLRPNSLVAVVMLSDENDCSVKASGQSWFVAQTGGTAMWKGTAICDTAPNDPCCYSCGQLPPAGCATPDTERCGDSANPSELSDKYVDGSGAHDSAADPDNLRCFHQKQRFGVDFLYPSSRYSNALSQRDLCVSRSDLSVADCATASGPGRILPNPLYQAPEGAGILARDSSLVFLAGIVGVPWQDIAVDPTDDVNIKYQTFAEMVTKGTWDVILKDGINPTDPLMIESVAPRSGTNPITNEALAPPTANSASANSINGHEWEPDKDLQYACTFPLIESRDCATVGESRNCDCEGAAATAESQQSTPLCQDANGDYGLVQHSAKAYPGIRELDVLRKFGEQTQTGNSVVASICARNVTDSMAPDFGYRPAIGAIVDRLKEQLQDRCLPRSLALDSEGNVPCSIVEARLRGENEVCSCATTARGDVNPKAIPLLHSNMEQNDLCTGAACGTEYCLCTVLPTRGADRTNPNLNAEEDCQTNEVVQSSTDGWCYVDEDRGIGSPDLVSKCPTTARRKLRFVGDGQLASGTVTFVACLGAGLKSEPVSTETASVEGE